MHLTGVIFTEDGICADTRETHVTWGFAGLWEHMKSQPRYKDLGFVHVYTEVPGTTKFLEEDIQNRDHDSFLEMKLSKIGNSLKKQ